MLHTDTHTLLTSASAVVKCTPQVPHVYTLAPLKKTRIGLPMARIVVFGDAGGTRSDVVYAGSVDVA